MSDALTTTELSRLGVLETTIQSGIRAFFEVGAALKEIRDSKLYRQERATFESYCRERWDIDHSYARRCIGSAEAVDNLKSVPIGILPENEAQCRPLTKLLDADQQHAWQTVVERAPERDDGTKVITAKLVQDVVSEISRTFVTPIDGDGYSVVYSDPPWKYGDERNHATGGASAHYPLMSIGELCDMDVRAIAAPNAVLFMWVTAPLFAESMAVIESWGFKYKTNLVWDKERPYYGHYSHVRHEHLCICTRGSCTPEPDAQLPQSIISIGRTRHSGKPHEFYELVDSLYPDGKRIELFARNRRDGWDSWGNEVDGTVADIAPIEPEATP